MAQTKGEVMHLADLKQKTIADLNDVARDLKIEGAANLRKQELIFAILQAQTEKNGVVFGEGVLETLTTFISLLRSSAASTFGRAILSPGRSDLPRKANAILRCSRSRR
jgi:transcription termination factor Rho